MGEDVPVSPLPVMQGPIDLLASARRHGYAIATRVRQPTDGGLGIEDAALYQALCRIDRQRPPTQSLSSLLVNVSPPDAPTFVAASVFCSPVTLAACFVPATRAMSLQPASMPRND
jgi:hypothetical protein